MMAGASGQWRVGQSRVGRAKARSSRAVPTLQRWRGESRTHNNLKTVIAWLDRAIQ
jgi:hypothetical protein